MWLDRQKPDIIVGSQNFILLFYCYYDDFCTVFITVTSCLLWNTNVVLDVMSTCITYISMYIINITGPPDDIADLNISPDTITACSTMVQWSDPMCGTVWYTVTIFTEGGIMITTDNTTLTNQDSR